MKNRIWCACSVHADKVKETRERRKSEQNIQTERKDYTNISYFDSCSRSDNRSTHSKPHILVYAQNQHNPDQIAVDYD